MFELEHFQCSIDDMGKASVWYKGESIPELPSTVARGSRQYFSINGEYFVKATYASPYGSQCKTETFTYGKLEDQDRKYFPEMIAVCDFKTSCHWSVWKQLPLRRYEGGNDNYWRCEQLVDYLCRKYKIADVRHCFNWNWFIHEGEPMIVDIGCD